MLAQIGLLKDKYSEWLNMPVDRPLRLFGSTWLEYSTKSPWWVAPLFWIPSIGYTASIGLNEAHAENFSNVSIIHEWSMIAITKFSTLTFFNALQSHLFVSFLAGIVLWTILEYSIHRWVFHLNAENDGVLICTFHFLIHGIHHKVDKFRNCTCFKKVIQPMSSLQRVDTFQNF